MARPAVSRRYFLAAAAIAGTYILASLFPYQLELPRRVRNQAIRDGDDVAFRGTGQVVVPDETISDAGGTNAGDGPLRIRIVAESSGPQTGPARLLTMSNGVWNQNLMVGQEGSALIVRVRRPESSPQGTPPLVVDGVFADRGPHEIEIGVDDHGVSVKADGSRAVRVDADQPRVSWDQRYLLLLGNERGGMRHWEGTIHEATYQTQLTDVDLLRAGVLPQRVLLLPDRLTGPWSALWNPAPVQLLHAFGMFALGATATLALRSSTSSTRVAVGCWLLSSAVFLLKFIVQGRHPSLADTLVEVVAASIGIAAASMWRRGRPRTRASVANVASGAPSLDAVRSTAGSTGATAPSD